MTVLATLVLVAITGYYAWWARGLVRETHLTPQAAARATLQTRLDRISEICIRNRVCSLPRRPTATGGEVDQRFHLTSMFVGLLEEAFLQHTEQSMSADDWSAWQATADTFLSRKYVAGYWQRSQRTLSRLSSAS